MSTAQTTDTTNGAARPATVPMRIEGTILPVRDVDRAKAFYVGLGWRFDGDFPGEDGYRIVQLTPPGSDSSILFGSDVTPAVPGSAFLLLVVDDMAVAIAELRSRGVEVSEPFHHAGGGLDGGFHGNHAHHAPGPDPEGRSYATYATFDDPDGNRWLLQQITDRLPGRV
jgi:catechol 2,3-dioxygenase-like lactoylglutathione lyase family enzyme